jgi:hypothetical protein
MSQGPEPQTEQGAALRRGRSARGSWLTAAAVARATGGEVLQRGGVAAS